MTKLLSAALLCLAFTGCSHVKRLTRIAAAHPDAAAIVCNNLFPVRESTQVKVRTQIDTQLIAGPVVYVDCDSARRRRRPGDTTRILVAVPCPPQQLITKLVTKDSIVHVESTAAITVFRNETTAAKISAAEFRKERNMWRWAALAMFGYLLLRIAVRFWLKIPLP